MKFKVYRLRRKGYRLAWRAVVNGQHYVGDLVSYSVGRDGERYKALTLRPTDPIGESAIPDLYEPILIGFAPLAFRVRGYERIERLNGHAYAVVQEWHCELP